MQAVLTIAGSDSGGGAGIQADLKTFGAIGVYGASAITAITAQNTVGVTDAFGLSADLVTAQIEAVATDIPIHATKTGMLLNAAIVEAVAAAIDALNLPNVVVDPVMHAKGGRCLLDDEGVQMLKAELLPRALVVTPNLPEAAVLSGCRIESIADARRAAQLIRERGASAVIVTGGHAPGDVVVDLLYDGHDFVELRTPRIETHGRHGTGCTYSAALAAYLALGAHLADAAARAQAFVAGAIRHAPAVGSGHGPLNHFWQTQPRA
jgi:hydroxymethylpyrimidine/phosphomethylpyrimidine kinase